MIRYLALEGVDGSGKDTQLRLLGRRLELGGITPITLHEPSYGTYGRALRARLAEFPEDLDTQRELFTRDREDHRRLKIDPALDLAARCPGFIVLQNRSILSAAAYQPMGESSNDLLRTIVQQEQVARMPDLVVILDVPVEVALARIENRAPADALERRTRLEGVRLRYQRISQLLPGCVLVNGDAVPDSVTEEIMKAAGLSA